MKKKYGTLFFVLVTILLLIKMEYVFASPKQGEFSGDLVITAPGHVVKAKLYIKDPYIYRLEMSEESGGMIFIRPAEARGKIWMLDPAKKQYKILSWPQKHKDPLEAWTDIQYDMKGGNTAKETIHGHPCAVSEFKYPGTDKVALKMWYAEDIKYTIKRVADAKIMMENKSQPKIIKGTFEILNIKTGKLDDTLFEVPAGYVEVK